MYIVTGGAGFIGSCLVSYLNHIGIKDILIVDNLGHSDKWKNLIGLDYNDYIGKYEFIDLIKSSLFHGKDILKEKYHSEVEVVFHFGACSSTTEQDKSYLIKNNYEYSKYLYEYCEMFVKKFVYASSAATYGDGRNGFHDGVDGLREYEPLNMYGYSKHMVDKYIFLNRKSFKSKPVGLKFFNVFGPNEYHKGSMKSMVYQGYYQLINNKKINLFKSNNTNYKDGDFSRDFIYVKDVVKMSASFLDNFNSYGIYNISTGVDNSWNNLASAIWFSVKKLNGEVNKINDLESFKNKLIKDKKINYIEMPEGLKRQYQYYTRGDNKSLIKNGYCEHISSLYEGVYDYVSKYLYNNEKYLNKWTETVKLN